MNLYSSSAYVDGLKRALDGVVGLEKLAGKTVLVTGATGTIGSFLVDMLACANETKDLDAHVYAAGRSQERLEERFGTCPFPGIELCCYDVEEPVELPIEVDMVIHAASNAQPRTIMGNPLATIRANTTALFDLLTWAQAHGCKRFLYVSSGEVYGEMPPQAEEFGEVESGYVDPLQLRSCYPVSKRMGENLCVAFSSQEGMEAVVVRPSHTYGPTGLQRDTRAHAQFLKSALRGEDIVLKSRGEQLRSYTYIADAAAGLLTVLLNGESGRAYNLANPEARCTIAEFARMAAEVAGTQVIFELDEEANRKGTPITHQVLATELLEGLGWHGSFTVQDGIQHALTCAREAEGR